MVYSTLFAVIYPSTKKALTKQLKYLGVLFALLCGFGFASLFAVTPAAGQEYVPTIQPRYTRIFTSEVMIASKAVLSPDERWVVFVRLDVELSDVCNLWVIPAAGGEPRQLTKGRHYDHDPAWFPGSDRIAFTSDRPSSPDGEAAYIMTLPFNSRTGEAEGPPQQVTLEQSSLPTVSPDGRWIAYMSYARSPITSLMIVPSSGGTARTLFEFEGLNTAKAWSEDGQIIYFSFTNSDTEERSIWKLPVDQGNPELISNIPYHTLPPWGRFSPHGRYFVRLIGNPSTYEITTLHGRPIARFSLNVNITEFTPDGHGFTAGRQNIVAPLRVLPVNGGPEVQIGTASAVDVPIGWISDSNEIIFSTQLDGEEVIFRTPASGSGPAREIKIPRSEPHLTGPSKFAMTLSRDGRYLLYVVDRPGGETIVLKLLELETETTYEITRLLPRRLSYSGRLCGRGGTDFRDGEDFLYLEETNDHLELRALKPGGRSRLLWNIPSGDMSLTFGVHGERIAFARTEGDSSTLFILKAGNEEPKPIVSLEGSLASASGPAWSPDGRLIAMEYTPKDESVHPIVVVEVSPEGEMLGEPKVYDAGASWWWRLQWLPTSRGLTLIGMAMDSSTDVWLIPLNNRSVPTVITRDDPAAMFWYEISPDGRYIAYSSMVSKGSSIWRVDLEDVFSKGLLPPG